MDLITYAGLEASKVIELGLAIVPLRSPVQGSKVGSGSSQNLAFVLFFQ